MIIAPTNTRAANTPKPVVCRPGQNVSERAREAFGERAAVCVTTGAGDRPVIGRVATRWSGPFFDVVES